MTLYIFYFFSSIYFASLIYFIFSLKYVKNKKTSNFNPNVSIIVCVRNGSISLSRILNQLKNQKYNGELEFIIVDDQSTDDTKEIILKFIGNDNRFKYFSSTNDTSNLNHKKKALNIGIESASNEYLLFTDVDCEVNEGWTSAMMSSYNGNDYVVGYSETIPNNSIVSHFQSIDFRMLMLSCVSTTFAGFPLACSGQNQSYKKSLFLSVGGFERIQNLLQGDDSIFLQICRKVKNIKVSFAFIKESYVKAKRIDSLKEFLMQRIRWAGDANIMWQYNKLFFIIILSTFVINLSYCILFLVLFFSKKFILLFIALTSVKVILEFSLYFLGSKKLNRDISIKSFFLWFIFNPFYTVLVGLLSFYVQKIKWKGRSSIV